RVGEEGEGKGVGEGDVREVELPPGGGPRVVVETEGEPGARRAPLGPERQAPGPQGEGPRAPPAPGRGRNGEVDGEEPEHVGAKDDAAPHAAEHIQAGKLVGPAHPLCVRHATLADARKDQPHMIDTSRVDGALQRSQDHLLRLQAPAGFWVGELEADTTITSEYLLLRHLLGSADLDLERKALRYLRARQDTDGSWNLYEAGAGDLSATIKAYFAMKMAGVSPDDPAMARAREWVLERGGPTQANVFTKITLALFGQYPWGGVPAMPVEIMLLPRWSYFNV